MMITAILIGLFGGLLYILFRKGRSGATFSSRDSRKRNYILFLIGILTLLAIFSPRVQGRINALKRKLKL